MSKLMKAAAAAILAIALLSAHAWAGSVNETDGVAIKGYDPIAYFTDNKPVKGIAAHSYTYEGVTYRFASTAHRKLFAKDPAKYVPEFGGFCAYGTSQGRKVDIDPAAFTIVNGKLYLNYNFDVLATWRKDEPGYIHEAEEKWPAVSQQTDVIH
jgi:YHS domain-containing protein